MEAPTTRLIAEKGIEVYLCIASPIARWHRLEKVEKNREI